MVQGVIARIFEKDFGQGPTYSFTLRGDRTFYRLGRKKPSVAEGDSVRFEANVKGANTYANDVVPWKEDGVAATSAVAVSRASSAVSKDDYWANKEARDVFVQKRIEIQSCRNSAIELVRLLLSPGVEAVKLPAKQADKEGVVVQMVAKYTEEFLEQNSTGPAGDKPIDETIAEEAATAPALDDLDNWN